MLFWSDIRKTLSIRDLLVKSPFIILKDVSYFNIGAYAICINKIPTLPFIVNEVVNLIYL